MQRSRSQKVLLVLSILSIISAVIVLAGGLILMVGGAAFGAADSAEAASVLEGSGITQGEAGLLASGAGLVIICEGIVELIMGILDIRAANDNRKIMPVWVISIIELILSAISLITTIVNGSFATQSVSVIATLVFAGLMMWIANNIKMEAGR